MTRYMSNWGEQQEFEAKHPDEIVCCLKKVFRRENESDPVFLRNLASDATIWSGAKLNAQCNRSFVKSIKDTNLLVDLSNQSEEQKTALLSQWSENGFTDIHFGKLTARQLETHTRLALKFRKIANSLNDHKLAEILSCELDGADYLNRYELLTDKQQLTPSAILNFVMTTIQAEAVANPAAAHVFPSIYTEFPGALHDYAVMWQFTLNRLMGKEFIRSALHFLADLLTQHPSHRHDLISGYLPTKTVPIEAKLYFAYGSNMDHKQMLNRCPGAEFVGLASLKNFEYYIDGRGVASVNPKHGATTWGAVWDIQDSSDWEVLDQYEGVSSNIYKRLAIEADFGGQLETCQVYISTTPQLGVPRFGYQEKITETVIFHKKLYEKKLSKMDGETASELGWDGYEYPFELWYSEMKSWLGAENG